jgi:hypothetical protein
MDSDRRNVMAPGDQTLDGRKPKLVADGPSPVKLTPVKPTPVKPTLAQLGIDPAALDWQRSGVGAGSFEVAFIGARAARTGAGADWVLLRVAGDSDGRVLVYDRTEWMCFLDGVARGEFG